MTNIKSGFMRFNARKYSLSCKSRSYFIGRCLNSAPRAIAHKNCGHLIERYLSSSLLSIGISSDRRCTSLDSRSNTSQRSYKLRFYSSEADVQNAGGDKENKAEETSTSRLSKRGERFRDEFLSRIVPWEKIPVSFENFPYYIDNETKSLLVECVASHLKHKKFRKYGCVLKYSSNRIQLRSIPGTELYRERLVSAVARDLQVPLLKLDSSVLPPYDISQCSSTEQELEEEGSESESDQDSDYYYDDATDEENNDSDEEDDSDEEVDTSAKTMLKKGDRVKYTGDTTSIEEVNNRTLPSGHRGEVHEVNGDRIAVIFHDCGLKRTEEEKDERSTEATAQEILTWLDAKDVKREDRAQVHDCFIAMDLLYEVLESRQPIVVYFPDSFFSILRKEASWLEHYHFIEKAKNMFEKLSGRVVLIYGHNKREVGSEVTKKFPNSMKQYINSLEDARISQRQINKLFTNVMCIQPPKDEDLNAFIKQIDEDITTVISQANISAMHQVLKAHRLLCKDLEQVNITDMILTRTQAEKIVSWATNHYLSSSHHPCVKDDLMLISNESLELGISRLNKQHKSKNPAQKSIKDLAEGSYEKRLVSAVVSAGDIGIKFDDVGALEHVKKTLYETVILPLKRPELFSHGILGKPCKGVLLFGPPGTGKTLMAKALATEVGANFINVTTATLTSKWYGETEGLTRALFSFARRLAPAIIFVDEVDSLLGNRDDSHEFDKSRLNEFMAAWDGLISKDSERILVMGATNRPFDLDDAVLRRMPRRIYVGLPDAENRCKILKILLREENVEADFSVKQLAEATEGYSGDDLKNLCVAAAYRPVHELLQRETKGEKCDGGAALRPLNMDDYIISKSKVRPSVSSDSSSIKQLQEWDEKYGEGGCNRF
ncbi:uncharacterized protein LOC130992108 [Salvia miltiorrhiza]|uniref:uncharacterized protein LOC130992108 n=1 Tax=Salvia miltiorrhiza TaxID=226208 RepID=UPI0025AD75C4|nr:uncharacterized protein LOC130992108 [Salvia miltiorrhiza]